MTEQQRNKTVAAQIAKYGSEEAFRAEMSRRAKMRKTIGKGGFYDPAIAKKAAAKSAKVRTAKAERKAQEESNSQNPKAAT